MNMNKEELVKPVTMDLFIGLHDNPSEWYPTNEEHPIYEGLLIEGTYAFKQTQTTQMGDAIHIKHPQPGHHPSLRFEDIVAHLTMQAMVSQSKEDLEHIIKTARQYGNQAMKKVCRNCSGSLSIMWDSPEKERQHYSATGMGNKSSFEFAEQIKSGECAIYCSRCRVGRTIVVANQVDVLFYGLRDIKDMKMYALRWKNKWYKTHCKLKKMRWERNKARKTSEKVIEVKRKTEAELREAQQLLKENSVEIAPGIHMKLQSVTVESAGETGRITDGEVKFEVDEEVIPKKPMPEKDPEPPKVIFDEFKDVPEEVYKKLKNIAIPDNAQIVMGSTLKEIKDKINLGLSYDNAVDKQKEIDELDLLKKEHVIDSMPPSIDNEEEE